MSGSRALITAALLLAALAPAAAAHVQVMPKQVAPNDPVVFTVLVPNERDNPTTSVQVEIPEGVVPFSFEDTPGWERQTDTAEDGSVTSVEWTGELPEGAFVRFGILASTPETEGTLTFRAVQTYADGTEAAWVGAPDSDEPAPTVEVTAAASPANAGGEGADDGSVSTAEAGAPESEPATTAAADTTAAAAADDEDGDEDSTIGWIGIGLGGLGLVAGVIALALVALRRPRTPGGGTESW
jgi:periplasmic copper chaperone A